MIKTRLGVTTVENNYYCGFDLTKELVGRSDTLDLITLATLNRVLTADEKTTIYALSTSQCVADPHAWPLRIARSGARNGSFFHGLASVLLYFERANIGPHQTKISAELLIEWNESSEKNALLSSYENEPIVPGFGVFGRPKDERVIAFKKWLQHSGFVPGEYFRAHETLIESLPERNENNTLVTAAILLDMGFSVADMESMAFFLLLPPVFANALESAKDQNPEMRDIPGPVEYHGPEKRSSPRQSKA